MRTRSTTARGRAPSLPPSPMITAIDGTSTPASSAIAVAMAPPSPRFSASTLIRGPGVSIRVIMGRSNLAASRTALWVSRKPSGEIRPPCCPAASSGPPRSWPIATNVWPPICPKPQTREASSPKTRSPCSSTKLVTMWSMYSKLVGRSEWRARFTASHAVREAARGGCTYPSWRSRRVRWYLDMSMSSRAAMVSFDWVRSTTASIMPCWSRDSAECESSGPRSSAEFLTARMEERPTIAPGSATMMSARLAKLA